MKKYWIPGPITNYGTTDAGFRGEVRVVLASDHEARLAEVEQDRDKWRERAFNSLRSQEVLRVTDSASVVQYKPCEICTTQSWCETHGCQCYPVSAVQPERCCLDYPRCDCNSPPESEGAE
jgi:hypothetical protein